MRVVRCVAGHVGDLRGQSCKAYSLVFKLSTLVHTISFEATITGGKARQRTGKDGIHHDVERKPKLLLQGGVRLPLFFFHVPSFSSTTSQIIPPHRQNQPSQQRTFFLRRAEAHQQLEPVAHAANDLTVVVKVGLGLGQPAQELELAPVVRLVPNAQLALKPSWCLCHGSAMRKGVERGFAAVGACAGLADAAKGNVVHRGVHEAVVVSGATRCNRCND